MKKTLLLLMAAATSMSAAGFLEGVTLTPVGALKTEHLDGASQWGAGFIIAKDINPFVNIGVMNLSFEGKKENWGGVLVDETAVLVDAKLSSFSKEKFSLHLVAGGQTDWNDNDYGINAGLRADLALSKHVSLSAGYSIRTWFKAETRVDSLATLGLNLKF